MGKLEELRDKIERLSPGAQLLMASQLVAKGDYDAVELGITIAENCVLRWKASKLLAGQATRP